MSVENGSVRNKKYEMVAPDGGWGYMICLALVLFSPSIMFASSFGIIYNDLIKYLHMGSTSVTLLGGVSMMGISLAGLFTRAVLKLMSQRKLAFLASFLFNLGLLMGIFVKSEVMFYICQITQCIGMGFLFNVSCTALNQYFVKKRLLANSIAQLAGALGGLVAPLLVEYCQNNYGYRGTLLIVGGVSLHIFIASALLQPVAWHMVKVEVEISPEEMKLLSDKTVLDTNGTTPTFTLTETNSPLDVKIEMTSDKNKANPKNSKNIISSLVDLSVLKRFLVSNACMGPAFCAFADLLLMMMLPQALYSMGWKKDLVAKAVALCSFGDLISRAFLAIFSKWLAKFGSQEIFLASIVIAFVSRLGMLCTENEIVVIIFITIMGVARVGPMVLPGVILGDIFGDKFTDAMGLHMMMAGIMNLVLGPAVGAIRDVTNSYSTAFYVLTSCYAVCAFLGSIELLYKRNKHKRVLQLEAAEKLKSMKIKSKLKQ